MRTAEKGDTAKAVSSLDRILEFQPTNREALLARAFLALTQAEKAPAAVDRAAAIEKARILIGRSAAPMKSPPSRKSQSSPGCSTPRRGCTPSRGSSTGRRPC